MESLKKDSLRLLEKVLSDTYQDLIFIHILQTELLVSSFRGMPEIQTIYGYVVDSTPLFLEREGVLKILVQGKFLIRDLKYTLNVGVSKRIHDMEASLAETNLKKFTNTEIDFNRYTFYSPMMKRIDPYYSRGLCYVVIDRKKAELWIKAVRDENTTTKNISPKEYIKEILRQYKFPRMQKKLMKQLSSTLPKDTKSLKKVVGTTKLSNLRIETLKTIKKHGLGNLLHIKSYKGGEGNYFYQLEVNMISNAQIHSKN